MIRSKLKKCKECHKDKHIFSNGLCLSCHRLLNKDKYTLKVRNPLKRSNKPVKKQSDYHRHRTEKYQRERDKYFEKHSTCEFPGCNSPHVTLHHRSGREGYNLFRDFMSVCQEHHMYIHAHPEESFKRGWMIKRHNK